MVNVMSLSIVKLNYEWNKESIAQNRCVNKGVTAIQCFGKCYLNKTLDIAKKAKGNTQATSKVTSLSVEYLPTVVFELKIMLPTSTAKQFAELLCTLQNGVAKEIAHPPTC